MSAAGDSIDQNATRVVPDRKRTQGHRQAAGPNEKAHSEDRADDASADVSINITTAPLHTTVLSNSHRASATTFRVTSSGEVIAVFAIIGAIHGTGSYANSDQI